MSNLTLASQQLVQYFFALIRQGQVIRSGMHVFGTHQRAAMSQGFHQDEQVSIARLGQSSREGMAEGIEDELCWNCQHPRWIHSGPICLGDPRIEDDFCGCGGFVKSSPKQRMQVGDTTGDHGLPFVSLEKEFAVGMHGVQEFKDFPCSLGLRKAPTSVGSLATSDRYVSVGQVTLPQRNTLLGSESEVEHQNRHLLQGVRRRGKVLPFQFGTHDEDSILRSRQLMDLPVSSEAALVRKDQRFSQGRDGVVDVRDTQAGFKPQFLKALDLDLGDLIYRLLKPRMLFQHLQVSFVKLQRAFGFRLLFAVFPKGTVQKVREIRRWRFFDKADAGHGEVDFVLGQPELRGLVVADASASLSSGFLVPEVELPNAVLFEKSHKGAC